jgi:GR25 family glycosyltransferase involved in LPS biosynthesis
MPFLSKYYKPWSIRWVIQRFILVIKDGKFFKISYKTLLIDYKSSRNVEKTIRESSLKDLTAQSDIRTNPIGEEKEYAVTDRMVTCRELDPETLSFVNSYFDHVYVINLEKRSGRREKMMRKLTRLRIKAELFPAEDGSDDENMREFVTYYNTPIDPGNAHEMEIRLRRKAITSPGAWGILKTYGKLLHEANERGFNSILCLEDDVIFAKKFEELFFQASKIIPENWKVLYLGASQHTWEENTDLITPITEPGENIPVSYYQPINTDGAFAVAIDRVAFPFLIKEASEMNSPFDSGALRTAARKWPGECFVLYPNLVIADVSESDIRTSRKQEDFAEIARWDLAMYDFND